ncbi:ABC transporter permease [Sporosarcina oncorhynchi]|uniref:ABC transporter permease n=1 Tax=Sporosarcina oncorhynchi TaxID=3056444 RepID=A0ABZ0LC08_9BACL|nr:ABC transporter permease [Sporosarcina sp. T2O-4]WOV89126.1 ABC transporter permease [Sporosarcina sp. T2O-4]
MARYILIRLTYAIITLFIIATLTFVVMKFLPGDPYGSEDDLTDQQIAVMNEKYGFDKPVTTQFALYMKNLVKGDLGTSFQYPGRDVKKVIFQKFPVSMQLGVEALIIGTLLGILLGIFSALKYNTIWDYGTTIVAVLGISIPSFILAVLLQLLLSVKLGWLPVGYWDGPLHHVLPVAALATGVVATISRYTRTEMLEILGSDYIATAESKGLSKQTVVTQHAVRNSLIPVVTVLGPKMVSLMTGTLVIESIFAIPGLGGQLIESIMTNDYPMIMGITLFYSALFIGVMLLVDVLYGVIDPRIRLSGDGT